MSAIVDQGQGNLIALEIFGPGLQTPGLFILQGCYDGQGNTRTRSKDRKKKFCTDSRIVQRIDQRQIGKIAGSI
jgi:hypothetical protein